MELSRPTNETTISCNGCQPNYEEEYYRNIEKIVKLERENAELKDTIIAMCKTFCKGGTE